MGFLKHFSGVASGLGGRQPPHVKRGQKGAWPGSRDPVNFWSLNGNDFKMAKDTNFKFGMHAPRQNILLNTWRRYAL